VIAMNGLGDRHRPELLIDFTGIRNDLMFQVSTPLSKIQEQ
jgi:hypothetical protein